MFIDLDIQNQFQLFIQEVFVQNVKKDTLVFESSNNIVVIFKG